MAGLTPTFGILLALGSALTWTVISLIARSLTQYFNTLTINMLRSAVGGGLLLLVILVSGNLGSLRGVSLGAWVAMALSVVTAFVVGDTLFFESTRIIGLGRAMTISVVYPLIASGLGVWFFGERITPALALGAILTLGGLHLVVRDQAPVTREVAHGRGTGLALALGAAAFWAVSALLMKAPLHEVDPLGVQVVRLPLAAVLLWLTPWARGAGGHVRRHLRAAGPRLAALGVLTALSAITFLGGLKYAGLTLGTVLSSTAPLFALPIGRVAYAEPVTWRAVAGAGLTVAGIAVLGSGL